MEGNVGYQRAHQLVVMTKEQGLTAVMDAQQQAPVIVVVQCGFQVAEMRAFGVTADLKVDRKIELV